MLSLTLTIISFSLLIAYEFIVKKMSESKPCECLNFDLHEMNLKKNNYQIQMRALVDDYNSLLIKMRKESDEFNAETTEISSRLETLYREQLSKG